MRVVGRRLASGLWIAAALLLPMAALESMSCAPFRADESGLAAACDDGSAHLAMGCASILL